MAATAETIRSASQVAATIALACAAVSIAHGQATLPAPSRTVYKCTVGEKITYSDEPCAGAQRLAIEPTRGLNKSTGREPIGADVHRELHNEAMAEAIRPLTGMDNHQTDVARRRFKLSGQAKAECARLDALLPELERTEREAASGELNAVRARLLAARKRQRDFGC